MTSVGHAAPVVLDDPVDVTVRAYPLDFFAIGNRAERRRGSLSFRGGVELQSPFEGFGGFSGLWRSPDGERLVAISDNAQWLTARVVHENGRIAGLADAVMAPILGPDGRPMRRTRYYDTECLSIVDGVAHIGIERVPAVMRFDFAKQGVKARGQLVPMPSVAREWPRNRGPEAIGIAPPASPVAGSLVVIAEMARLEPGAPTQGLILTGARRGSFDVARSDDFDVTDLAFLPDGDILVLERRFSILRGIAARIRRLNGRALRPGATLDGPVIFEADAGFQVDNMEGLAIHRNREGETILTLISDDNFSILQRTIILEFVLAED